VLCGHDNIYTYTQMTHLIIGISAGFTIGFIAAMLLYEDLHKKYRNVIDLQSEQIQLLKDINSDTELITRDNIVKEVNLN